MTEPEIPDSPYINFVEQDRPVDRKTKIWAVISHSSGETLGLIKWYGPWRQYCFYPSSATIWNIGCLGTVQSFIRSQMVARRIKV